MFEYKKNQNNINETRNRVEKKWDILLKILYLSK